MTVDDDETAGVSVSVTELAVAEGGSAAYTVVLDAQPASNVVIGVTRSGSSDVTVDRATLTFSPSNWDTAQTVTVRAAQDADAVNDAASITHAVDASRSADEYDAVSVAGVAVTVADDDTAGVSVSETTLTVAEGNSSTYTVVLDAQPASNVVIGVTRSGSPDVTVDRATLTFSPSNWDTAQTVTVRAAQDADAVNDAASITHAVDASRSADEYDAVSVAGVAVTVADDDAGVSVSETTLTVAEGNSSTYTVVLDAQPASNVVIGVTRSGSSDVTVSPATLTFSPSNWDTAQTVTVRAAQDADAVNDAASTTHAVVAASSADEYDAVSVAGVAVTVADDDTAGVSVSETTLTVAEGNSSTYTVVLDAQPASNVVIGVTRSGSSDVTVSPATLTFSPSNWDTAQTVTVRAAQDADAVNDAASTTHAVVAASSADEFDNVSVAGVAVTVADDDTAGVSVSETTLTVAEGNSSTYTVVLDAQPASNVVITVSSDNSDVTADTDAATSGNQTTLTFTSSNWDTAQTVTVRAAQDADAVNDAASTTHAVVAASSADEFDNVSVAGVAVTVADDDAGVSVSETTLTVAEGNSSTYTVVLDAQPASNVVITVSSDNSDVTADTDAATSGNQTTLTFTSSNWDTAQTVTVRAAQDADAVNDAASTTHAVVAASSADEYDAVSVAGVAVTVADDDAGVSVSETTLTVAEGNSSTYTVVLDAQPASNVVIGVTRSGSSDVTVDRATLTFSPSNWDTAQTVTVRAAQDADAVNDAASITHAVDASRSADEYDAVSVAGVAVTVADDDAGVSVSETTLTVAEGNSSTYTVVLDAQPASNVVIGVTISGSPDVTVSPATLTFSPSNWDTAQTVTVRAAQDADAVNDAASTTHAVVAASSADEFDNVSVAGVAVTVADDDAGVSVSETTLTVAEGNSSTYTVVLDAQPASNVVIGVTRSGSSDVTVSPATLTFTSSNWDTAQTVTVRAAQDADAVNDAASTTHAVVAASSADEYDAVSVAGVAVTVADDDAGVSVSETTLTVAEGNSSTYTVVLDAQPASNVVIGVTRSGSSDVTVDRATLTFSPSNWDTAQTVTVRAAQDADAVNDAASITHAVDASRSADEYDAVSVAGVAVTVADDDAGVSVSETTLTVAEGNSSTYTVVLDAQPASNVVIGVTISGSPDVTVSPATLTFSPSNWDTAQTVTVRAAQDADAVNDAASITHAVDASRSADEYDAVSVAGVAVTVADDDAGVSVSETTLTVAEGNSSTYTVVLDAQPASNVVIGVTRSGSSDVTVSPATLTFSPSNWDTAQTVTVRAAQDADAVNDAASITHAVVAASSADEYDAVSVAGVAVTVADDDAGVSVSETTLTVAEGNSSTYTVVLDAQPASNVVIGVTRSGSSDVTVSPATLTFSPSNWDTAQTVTVRAAQDADAVNDAASITHAVDASRSADEYDAVSVAGVAVTVADDDAGVSVSETTLTVAEGNSSTYTVVLDAQPASNVVIGVTISGSPDVTVSPATLTFSPSNWDTAQTVTVRAAQDADAVNDAASITHAVDASRSADEYDAVSVAGVAVTVADDDAGVSVSETTLTVAEGNSSTYTVVLDAQPASNVVIGVTRSGSSDVTVSPATLTFSPSNWDTAQTVTVRAAQDADAVNDAASITHAVVAASSADEYDNVSVAGVAVTVADDDAGVSVSETTLTVAEGNSSTYTVVLDAQPASNVVIGVTRSGSSDVTVSPATLTFSPSNWDTAQTVTVRAAQDADAVNDAASTTHAVVAASSADEFDNVSVAGVAVTVADDDAGVSVSETTLTVAEGNSSTYTVVLDAQPASNVVITVSSDNSDVTADTDAATSGNQTTLTFTSSNWDTAQTVTVRAAQDADAVNDAASITHAVDASRSADEFDNVSVAGVAVTVADDDTAGVSVSETTLTVAEGNSSTYTVVLDAQPASNVVIGVTISGSPDVTVDRATLTFSPSNWDTAQTVTVRAAQDADAVNDAASITHAVDASRSADEYDAVSVAGVAVTVADDDAGVSVSETTLTVAEGNSSTYTVVLDAQPASNVVIGVTRSGSSDVTVSPATLTFSPSNWDTAQTVTVRAAQDADAVNDAASTTHAVVAASSADEFDNVSVAGVAVTVADDDAAGVSVSETTLTVAEGNSSTYTVVLDAQPASNVVIGVTRSGSSDVTVSPATLTFSPSNWDTAQTVTVSAAQDADAVNDAASITHAVDASRSADEYDAVSVAGVAVTVADDDAGVSVSETTLTVAEGNSSTYTVVLDAQPASNVVIGVTRSGSSDVTVSPATLTFSPSNWDTAQTVTVRAAQDADAVNDAASITHAVVAASSADEYDNVSVAGVAVTVADDDAGVSVSETTLTVAEGNSSTYTVVLDAQPASNVVIGVTRSGSSDVTVSPATLTFSPSNWDTAQTVTVRAAQDADAVNDAASTTHAVVAASSADEFDNVSVAGVAVTVADDDAGVSVSETTLTVAEGNSSTYTVVLDAQPASNVVITVSSDNSDVTADTDAATSGNQTTLTFTSSNWDTAQTVTVRAAQDADAVNDAASTTHAVVAASSADEYDAVSVAGVAVTVADDDAGVSVSETTLTVAEGNSSTYTVVLDAQPASNVVIGVTRSGSSDVTVDRATLTFSPSNWDTAQTVTVRAAQDADAVNDAASITHAVDASRSADEYDAVSVAGVAVTVADDDAGVSVSETTLTVAEGNSSTYTVVLDAQPASNVVIGVTISGSPDVTVSPATLTFSPSNWDTAQTVTVRAAQDADAVNDAASITHAVDASRSADEYDAVSVAGVAVTVADDDAGVSVSETTLTVAEGNSSTYTVVLDAQPASNVVIGVTRSGSSDVTVSPATLTFSPSNWDTAQTVTVRAAQDADAVNDAASITHAVDASRSADEYDAVSVAGVAVTVADDDTAGVSVSETTLTVAEGNSSTYTVVLDAQPASNVVIGVTRSGSSDVTVSPATLTFSPSNWDTAQTVTVRAAQDADAVNDAASITHAVDASRSADEYDAVSVAGVAVTVADDDAGVSVSETTLTVAEGNSSTYTVVLDAQPASNVVIGVTISGSSDVTVSPATLTFSPSNWDTAQTVTVRAAQDADAVNDAASITHAVDASRSADEFDNVSVAGVAVTVADDDAGVSVSETTLTVAEGNSSTYTVVLDAQPASNVVIGVTRSGSSDVTVSPATLTFSPSNWDTAQTVTVRAAQDADAVNDAASTTHAVVAASSADEFDNVSVAGVAVTVADDDAGVSVSETTLTVAEGNSSTYTVVLDAQPASNVVIGVTISGSPDVTVSPATLTFSPSNWDTAQTVTVRAAQDADAVNDAASITHAVDASRSADEYDAVSVAGVAVTVADDDAGVSVSETTLTVAEGNSSTYTVVLDAQPASNVVIGVTRSGSSDVTVSPATLTFSPSNWDTAQTVTVSAAQDADAVNDAASITHAVDASRSADEYDAVSVAGVAVTVADDDTAGVSVSETTLTVAEGNSSTYTVVLDAQPASNVVIGVTRSGSSDVTVSPATLTFSPSNWDTAQTVTVRAAQDADAVNDAASITHAVDASRSADEFDNVSVAGVAVTVADDDTAGVSVSETTLTVAEGNSSTYTVVLDAQPASNVVIGVTRSGSSDVTVDRATLTFSPSNWDTAQTVTVRAAQDADAVNDAASITHAVDASRSADEYDAVSVAGVAVTVADDDAGVSVSETTLTVAEGNSSTYTVVLDAQPASNVVIGVTISGSPDVTVDRATLTFSPSNWDTAQTVTVRAAQDADAVNDAASITHAVDASRSADEYDAVSVAGVAVTVADDDAGVSVSETTLTVAEGNSSTYTVVLDAQPASNVVIGVTRSGSSDVTVSPATLTFSPSNWDTAQTVTVRAAQDADAVNDAASTTHAVVAASSADEFDNVSVAGVAVTVADDDAGVSVSETTLTVAEGNSSTYTVVLDAQPASNVVIGVTRSGSSDVTVSPATLTFSPSNWDTAQTVTVRAAQDADAVNDAASITHAVDASRSADEYDAVSVAGVAVTVADDDTAGVSVSETTLTVAEGNSSTYTVVLDAQPASNVVIGVTRSGSSDVTVSPATLTFSPSNWDTAQTVTVRAAQDADAVNDAASTTHAVVAASSADEFDNVSVAGVAVTVADDDAGVSVSETTLTVAEGNSSTYTVVLDAQPASNVVIGVTRSGSSDVTVSPATLTFSPSNWDTAQTVTVRAAQDADAVNDAASTTHAVVAASSADEFDNVSVAGVAVTVADDDTAGVSVSETTLTVAEGNSSTYTVVLDAQPASNVVIGVTRSGSPDVTVDRATLTFSPSNWDTAQTVTVRAAQDADAVNDAASITHAVDASRSADEYDAVSVAGVAVTVADDDAGVSVSETTLTVAEGNSSTYTVVLDAQPASNVVIGVTRSGSSDVTVSPATLTFSPSNWDTAQTVTVRAAQDADAVNDAASTTHAVVAASSADEYDAVSVAGVAVTVADDDAGVSVSETTLTVAEGNSSTYTVVLDAQPASNVVIGVTRSGSSDVTVSPATLTFSPSNWDTAQTVTVRAAQDADAVNDAASITHAVVAASSADEFDNVSVAGVAVTVADDDAGVSVSETTLTVAEGNSSTYTVVLDAQPASNVVIGVTRSGSSDVTVSPATLTFSPSNWDTAQTVTVRAAQDADAVNDAASTTHAVVAASSADEFDNVSVAGVAVTVADDDTAGVSVSETTLTVAEGNSSTYTVVLDAQPASNVVIGVTRSGSSDVTVSPATLTFSPSNWDTAQTVTVRAAQDADAVNDAASTTHAVVAASSADEFDNVSVAGVAVTVADDDAGVSVSETTLTVAEGNSSTYTVVLDAQPASNVVITVSSDNSDVTADTDAATSGNQTTLTFTSSNWDTAQTVTVRAAQDADAVNDAASTTHAVVAASSADEFDNVSVAGVAVTVADDDAGVSVSETTLTVAEGNSSTYTVVLDAQPASNVVIGVTRSGSSDVTVSPATLTFSPSNWDTAQTVTVRAAQDADAVNDAASTTHAVVAASSADEYDNVSVAGVAVTVADDDAGVSVSETTLTVAEGNSSTYTVVLDAQPASNVVIGVTRSGSSDVTVSPATLTFSPSNWDTAQTVTVRAAQDADAVNDAASTTHAVVAASSADEYDAVSVAGVAVTVADDDAGVSVSETTLTVAEGNSSTYTVVLDAQPASNVVIGVTRSGSSDVTVSPATLTFSPSNWDTAQTVTVRAAQDADAVNDAASTTHAVVAASSADEFDNVSVAGVAVTVADDDTAGVSVSETTLTVAEGNSSTYTVVLDAQPASNVVIGVTRSGSSDVTVSPATLTFSPSNWDTAQTVTVRAAQDADAVNDAASITHAVVAASSADEYDAVSVAGVAVTVADDDAGVSVSETTLTVAEGNSSTYTVVLDAQPASNVVIGVTRSGSSDVTVSPATLTFSPSNWDTAQTVTVRAAQDADAVNDAASITHAVVAASSADEYDAVSVAGVAVTVADDDAGVSVSETTLTVAEGNSSTYTVVLDAQPASNVVIGVTRSGSSDVTVDRATLTFSPSNWDTAQTVTVRAAQDADAVNDAASITHAVDASRSADEYDAVSVAGVAVTVADDDAGVSVSETTLTVAEGNSSTYTVVLDAQPASNVVIGVTRSGSSDVTVSPATLTFSPSNWDTAQTVTVRAAQDADAVNDAASITHAVDASRSADEYDAVSVAGVAVTVADDDAGVSVSETTLTVAEGNSSTYTVVLDAQPASNVVIGVTISGSSDVTVSPATLTFSPSNWDTAQTVTVRAAQDADAVNDAASITHAVDASRSADEYDAVSVAGVAVTVADDDAGVSVSETTLTVAEGNSSTYTVVLDAQPASNVVIGVTRSGSSDVTVSPATLTFTSSNWDTAQTVTVRAAQDADAVNDAASITHAVDASRSADEYDAVSVAGVAVTVADDDSRPPGGGDNWTPAISIAADTSPITEGSDANFIITASPAPSAALAVTVRVSGGANFTTVSGNKTVRLAAGADTARLSMATIDDTVDEPNEDITATLQARNNYRVRAPGSSASITVTDNDAIPGAPTELTAAPGDGQVELSWTAPANHGNSRITHYTVEYSTDSNFRAAAMISGTADAATTLSIGGLTNGVECHFWVRAVNVVGPSDWSAPAIATPRHSAIVPIAKPAPTQPPDQGGNETPTPTLTAVPVLAATAPPKPSPTATADVPSAAAPSDLAPQSPDEGVRLGWPFWLLIAIIIIILMARRLRRLRRWR